jgi:hypothetical protein
MSDSASDPTPPAEVIEQEPAVRAFWEKPENALAVIAIVLSVVAIVFAIIQFHDASVQTDLVQDISKGVSTRFIGLFPKNMDGITSIVKKTDHHLDIMVDFAAYGAYSNPVGFEAYLSALKDIYSRNPKAEIRVIIYGDKPAAASTASQFALEEEEKFKTEILPSATFDTFFRRHAYPPGRPSTKREFQEALKYYQDEYRHVLCDTGVKIRTVDTDLMFFLWLEDNEEAAFSFQDKGKQRELTMRTVDGNLINPMHELFRGIWNDQAKNFCNAEEQHQ